VKIPFLAWLLQGIPESIALASVAIALATGTLPRDKIMKIGLLQALSAYIIRLVPFTPGVHVLLLITTLAFFLIWICQANLKISVITSAITLCVLLVFEVLFTTAVFNLGIVNPNDLIQNTILRIVVGYPQIIFLFFLAFLINKRGCVLGNIFKRINYF
jgi:hypothetical protein